MPVSLLKGWERPLATMQESVKLEVGRPGVIHPHPFAFEAALHSAPAEILQRIDWSGLDVQDIMIPRVLHLLLRPGGVGNALANS